MEQRGWGSVVSGGAAGSRTHQEQRTPKKESQSTERTKSFSDRDSLIVCFFLSGAASLVYEVAWFGRVQLLVGHTLGALALTVCSFLGGLTLGALSAPKILSRRKGLWLYLGAEAFVSAWGLTFPALMFLAPKGSAYLAGAYAAAVLLIPAFAMGVSLPALLGALKHRSHLPVLYGANTLGGAAGAFLGGFIVLPLLGFTGAMLTAALINLAVLFLGLSAARNESSNKEDDAIERIRSAAQKPARLRNAEASLAQTLALLFIGGVFSMGLQVLWNRFAALAMGPTVYVFPAVLTVMLVGMGAGGLFFHYGKLQRFPLSVKTLAALLSGLWSFALLSKGPEVVYLIHASFGGVESAVSFLVLTALELGFLMLACAPASFVLGAWFPALCENLGHRKRDVTGVESSGLGLALNLSGALLAAVLFVQVVLPAGSLTLAAALLIAMSLVAALIVMGRKETVLSACLVGVTGLGAWLILPFDMRVLTSGAFYNRYGENARKLLGYDSPRAFLNEQAQRLIDLRDDGSAVISVHESAITQSRSFKINGKVDGGTGSDMITNQLVADLPFFMTSEKLERVLTIGLGIGSTHDHVLRNSEVKKATVAEISPVVAKMAREHFGAHNGKYWEDARSELVLADGRTYLERQKPGSFDLIVSEPSNAWVSGEAGLFSVEFFETVKSRLTANGVASLWFHSYGLGCESVKSVFKAVSQVFPRFVVFFAGGDYFVVASPNAQAKLSFSGAAGAHWYRTFEVTGEESFLTKHLYFDQDSLSAALETAVANTDANQVLQHAGGRSFYKGLVCQELERFRVQAPALYSARNQKWNERFE